MIGILVGTITPLGHNVFGHEIPLQANVRFVGSAGISKNTGDAQSRVARSSIDVLDVTKILMVRRLVGFVGVSGEIKTQ